jgi:hypothetical protein
MPSQDVPVPVHGPLPSHCFCVASLMHLPLTGQALSFVHQQHCAELPHCPWFTSHAVPVGHALLPPRLQNGASTEQPALSVNWPPVHAAPPEHLPLLQPPLLPMFVPPLLHSASAVQRQ